MLHIFDSLFIRFKCIFDPGKPSHFLLFALCFLVRKHFSENMREVNQIKLHLVIGEAILVITRGKLVLSKASFNS